MTAFMQTLWRDGLRAPPTTPRLRGIARETLGAATEERLGACLEARDWPAHCGG